MANQKKLHTKREVPKNCIFCKDKKNPDFLDTEVLHKFTTDRGKILSASKTGVCLKHQKKITIAVKRARHLALLPFVVLPD
ncbi:MAG: 30S ribosomal protein S18 [Candidatus Levybacteria bacterium]|nr:30S ribosomal protein S18 [Candidatus Levybacteria bacterium]MBP9815376.1 30S ribosomal protein S18 [Candidatus Levybacteria bacterium]